MAAIQPPPPPTVPPRKRPDPRVRTPFLKFSSYDRVSSLLMAVAVAVVGGVIWAFSLFWTTIPPKPPVFVPMEMVERVTGGGVEDGDPNATLNIQSPEEESDEVRAQDEVTQVSPIEQVADVLKTVDFDAVGAGPGVGVSTGPELQQAQIGTGELNGNSVGTGNRRPLGFGPGNGGGVAAELRWFIRFADGVSLTEYAKQLDFFGIELGAIMPDGRMAYITGMSGTPRVRYAQSGKDEKRLYMKWESGERRKADEKLFQKAGINVGRNVIFHFYPEQTEGLLVTLEKAYAKRALKEIRRTYFAVNTKGSGYEFEVVRQTYLR